MDNLTREQRAKNMSAIKSRKNKSTEERFLAFLKSNKIIGWRRTIKKFGSPDIVFPKLRILIFLDGCFWHKCPSHFKAPKSNSAYWNEKIKRNRLRDKEVNAYYKNSIWQVIRIWEHNIKENKLDKYLKHFQSKLKNGIKYTNRN